MKLNELRDNEGARKDRTRVGRGMGSGKGKTSGSGQKGQKARTGVALNGYEGGQMPLYQRLPKRGFTNVSRKRLNVVNLERVQQALDAKKLDAKKDVNAESLKEAGVIKSVRDGVRLLGDGELKTKVNFVVNGASKSAVAAVEKAGGKVEIVAVEAPAKEGKRAKRRADAAEKREAKKTK